VMEVKPITATSINLKRLIGEFNIFFFFMINSQ